MRTCEIEGCDRAHEARGLCDTHYARSRRGIQVDAPISTPTTGTPEERFWAYVDASDGCWEWTGSRRHGYGQLGAEPKPIVAHRLSYEIHHGPIPDGLFVCHACDNRGCVNPDHLFLGTQLDNMRDMVSKGRGPRGESHGRRRLTADQVLAIRKDDRPQQAIADDYGVTQTAISAIKRRRTWACLEDAS